MIYIVQNLGPILAATLAGLLVSIVWARIGGRRWTGGTIAVAALAEFWFASILAGALILAPPKADAWVMAIGTAVVIWIGFVVPALVVTLRGRGTAGAGIASECGHWLAVMVVQAVVLHAIGLGGPTG